MKNTKSYLMALMMILGFGLTWTQALATEGQTEAAPDAATLCNEGRGEGIDQTAPANESASEATATEN